MPEEHECRSADYVELYMPCVGSMLQSRVWWRSLALGCADARAAAAGVAAAAAVDADTAAAAAAAAAAGVGVTLEQVEQALALFNEYLVHVSGALWNLLHDFCVNSLDI
jgi:hypothetical protein